MTTLKPLTAREVTEPGAYEWHAADGTEYLGFIRADRRGRLNGAFISKDGALQAIAVRYSDDNYCEGVFFGPLVLPGAKESS